MRKSWIVGAVALAAAATLASQRVLAGDAPPAGGAPSQDEMMKKWMEMAAPTENHKWLGTLVGDWDVTMQMSTCPTPENPKPEQPPPSKGSASFRWQLEGKWLAQEFSGEMMGMTFKGFGLWGYDNYRKQFVGSWVDSMSMGMGTMTGQLDASKKVLTTEGLMDDPSMDRKDKKVRYVHRTVDADSFVFEMHDLEIGAPNTKVMELSYKRKK
jgi:hypothetical protein